MLDPSRLTLAVSLLAGPPPLIARVDRAVDAGYNRLESWWPWEALVPTDRAISALEDKLTLRGAQIQLMNLAEGDLRWGGRGLGGVLEAEAEFLDNATAGVQVAQRLGIPLLHILAGNADPHDPRRSELAFEQRLSGLAVSAARSGVRLVVEVLNRDDHPDYLLGDPDTARGLIERVKDRSGMDVGLMLDTYHFARSGYDIPAFLERYIDLVAHVQFADYPGRGGPGTGQIAFGDIVEQLDALGYSGCIGLEHRPDELSGAPADPAAVWESIVSATSRTSRR